MKLKEQIQSWLEEVEAKTFSSADDVEQFRIDWLGRKGRMKDVMAAFKESPNEEKRELGKLINQFKQSIESRIAVGSGSWDLGCNRGKRCSRLDPARRRRSSRCSSSFERGTT